MGIINIKITTITFLILLVSTSSVLALGVNSPYWDTNPLQMHPGQVKEVAFSLVSKPTDPLSKAFVTLDESSGIAEIISGLEYTIPSGTEDGQVKVILKISVLESAAIGETYDVKFSVRSAPGDDEGAVQLAVGYNIDFPVEVISKTETPTEPEIPAKVEKSNTRVITWTIIIAVFILIIYLFLRRKR